MWPIIHAAEARMGELAAQHQNETDPVKVRLLNQLFRELLLVESSDWPFLVTTFQAKDYAIERFMGHKDNFWQLEKMLSSGKIDEAALATLEEKDNLYPHIDYKWYSYQSSVNSMQPLAQ
jgi:1,4-alpha-glucan branching enzyme